MNIEIKDVRLSEDNVLQIDMLFNDKRDVITVSNIVVDRLLTQIKARIKKEVKEKWQEEISKELK